MKIGVIGLGLMGDPIARRLLARGHDVVVTSRRRVSATSALGNGATWANDSSDLIDRDVVITMLPSAFEVREALGPLLRTLVSTDHSPVVVDMSTIGVLGAEALHQELGEFGIEFADAPVSGGPSGAENGALAVMVGASITAMNRIRPVLEDLGTVRHLGPPGRGQAVKLVNQVLIAGIMAGIADAFALSESLELEPDAVLDATRDGFGGSSLAAWAWPRLRDGDHKPGFRIEHFLKDLDLAIDAASDGAGLPLVHHVRERYARIALEHPGLGTQSLVLTSAQSSPPPIAPSVDQGSSA